jgi:hypothetical protein
MEGIFVKIRLPLLAAVVIAIGAAAAGAAAAGASTQAPAVVLPPGVILHGGFTYMPSVKLPRNNPPDLSSRPKAVEYSDNWAGYAAAANSGIQLTTVGGDFNIPSVNCAKSPVGSSGYAFVAHWVGLDGLTDGTVEQTGVDAYCDSSGTPGYFAWYEMYPLSPVAFSGVSPGDAITTTVTYNATAKTYHMNLTDVTTGGSVTSTQSCPSGSTCSNLSAEAISEDPGGAVPGGYNLADFGMENYTATHVTDSKGLSSALNASADWTSTELIMQEPSTDILATPGGLYDGRAFNVSWKAAS